MKKLIDCTELELVDISECNNVSKQGLSKLFQLENLRIVYAQKCLGLEGDLEVSGHVINGI